MDPREGARTDDRPQDSAALPPAGEPGDLGKRVSRRRQDLKLSRRQLAGLAGVSVPYLQDLEAHHSRPTQAALRRLAADANAFSISSIQSTMGAIASA